MDAGIKGVLEKHGYKHLTKLRNGGYLHIHKDGHTVEHDKQGDGYIQRI